MHHPKSSRSNRFRAAMIPAVLICAIVSGCAEQQPTGPGAVASDLPGVARTANATFGSFFVAWSQSHSSSPIQTQTFALDARQERQYVDWYPNQAVFSFARANPGRIYILGDEPDQWCMAPDAYAAMYQNFVSQIRAVDPTARLSPAGFAEPNAKCCPPEDKECHVRMHSISYAERFYNAYIQSYGTPPPVDEWRFHDFALRYAVGDVEGWWAAVDRAAAWSVAHGANMFVGAWGFLGWKEPIADYQEHIKQGMGRLMNDSRINGAAYWAYKSWAGEAHFLAYDDGSLTPQGQTYANPLTDIPASVTAAASPNGGANLQWSNTTSAWAAEAEYWVKPPGTGSFVYKSTARLTSPGLTQTPLGAFNAGDSVRGRVRYYHAHGQASWSPFSNAVLMPPGDQGANKGSGSKKGPRFCFLPTGLQSQSCG